MGLATLETMTVFRTHVLRSSAACLAVVLVLVCSPEWVAAQQVQTPKTQKVQKVQKKAKPKAKAKAKAKAKREHTTVSAIIVKALLDWVGEN